jgi:NAD(P)-dependent dehydrogenase (short-subunit alcohol dehydrogenase family)
MSLRPWCPGRGIRPLSGNDKQILITGATNGIGLAAAEALAALGANLAIVGRSKTRTRIASARIRVAAGRGATVGTFIADLSSQASVRRLAAEVLARYPKLDVLVNNAGAMYGTRQLTKDGIELTWAVILPHPGKNIGQPFLRPPLAEEARTHRVKCSCPDDSVTHCRRALAHDIRHNALNTSNHLRGSAYAKSHHCSPARMAFASLTSRVSNPSGKRLWTDASTSSASACLPCCIQSLARSVAARSSSDLACWLRAICKAWSSRGLRFGI